MQYHLAQLNIGRLRWPLDDPRMAGFVGLLEPINALADSAPGFVWRLQTEEGDATSVRAFDDDMLLVNFSVWENLAALRQFTYKSDHTVPLRQRQQWFDRMSEHHLVLWWVPAGELPTLEDARQRLETLREAGPTRDAFTFRQTFDAPT